MSHTVKAYIALYSLVKVYYLLTADTSPAALMPLFNEQQQGNPILPSQKYRIPLQFYKEKHEHSTTTVVVALWKWKVFLLCDTLTHHSSVHK